MKRTADYTLVGLFVVFLTVLLFGTVFWLSAERHDRQYYFYQINFAEGVTGLHRQSLVRYNGVSVGFVKSIRLNERNPQLVNVVIGVELGTPVTVATIAKLGMQGITGSVYVELESMKKNALDIKRVEGVLPEIPSQPSLLVRISEVLPHLVTTLNDVGRGVKRILNQENRQNLTTVLHNTQVFSASLADSSRDLERSIAQLKTTMNNTATASKALPQAVVQLQKTLQSIARASRRVSGMSSNVATLARSGNVVIKHVSQQFLPAMQQTTLQLHSLLSNVNQLSQKLNRNPSILIRGQQPRPLGPGE